MTTWRQQPGLAGSSWVLQCRGLSAKAGEEQWSQRRSPGPPQTPNVWSFMGEGCRPLFCMGSVTGPAPRSSRVQRRRLRVREATSRGAQVAEAGFERALVFASLFPVFCGSDSQKGVVGSPLTAGRGVWHPGPGARAPSRSRLLPRSQEPPASGRSSPASSSRRRSRCSEASPWRAGSQ